MSTTTKGKLHILKFLARQVPDIARGIAIGVSNDGDTVSATDTHLGFEFSRSAVNLVSADFNNNLVIFKATIPADVIGQFTDIGLFTSETIVGLAPSRFITDFSEVWSVGSQVTTNSHFGENSLLISASVSTTITSEATAEFDLSNYDRDSLLKLAYHASANVSEITITLSSELASSTHTFTPAAPGYQIEEFALSDLVGAADLSAIIQLSLEVVATAGGTAEVTFDGLRIDAFDPLDEEDTLIAHKILGVPFVKTAGIPMDIEYRLEVTL